jgi:alpha-galactosidase
VRSCFWANKAKDDIMQQTCAAVGGIFVDISKLGKDESNYARSERSFAHAGVANHPGDKGMKAIADALLRAMTSPDRKQQPDKEHAAKP